MILSWAAVVITSNRTSAFLCDSPRSLRFNSPLPAFAPCSLCRVPPTTRCRCCEATRGNRFGCHSRSSPALGGLLSLRDPESKAFAATRHKNFCRSKANSTTTTQRARRKKKRWGVFTLCPSCRCGRFLPPAVHPLAHATGSWFLIAFLFSDYAFSILHYAFLRLA